MVAAGAALEHGPRFRDGARAIVPIAVMAAVFGASYGVLARSAGLGSLAPVVMSATTFAGSAQFAAASVLATGGGAVGAIGAAALLNARYAPISLTVAPSLGGSLLSRVAQSQLVVDESWAVAQVGGGRVDRKLLVGAGLVLYAAWVGGTIVGVLGAQLIGDPARYGLDAAFPALFLALLVPQVRGRRALLAALLGAEKGTSASDRRRGRRMPPGATAMREVWLVVAAVGAATVALKSAGPVLAGGKELPPPLLRGVALLAPALLAALVAVQVFGGERELVLDARVVGLGAAAAALALRAPILAVVAAAAVATALARAL